MLLRLHPRRDEAAALVLDDVASALDAGLPLTSLGAAPADGERVLHGLLRSRGVALEAADEEVLAAAWLAGRAPIALRRLAETRRAQAAFARDVYRRLAYPALVLAMSMVAATVVGLSLPGGGWLPAVAVPAAALAIAAFWFGLRGLARGDERVVRLPFLSGWAADLAELPYLEVLGSLYASGVPLLTAHPRAIAACPVASVRERLRAADAVLQARQPLAEALQRSGALHQETRQLVAAGERAGELEQSLDRALVRRRDVASRGAALLGRILGTAAYAIGAGIAIAVVFSAYGAIFGALRR